MAMLKALDRKLLRDLRGMWSQALTIALVVASGIGGFITTLSAVNSLSLAREAFYAEGHFADVFAAVKRAPDSLAAVLREVPGVADVQTTTEEVVRITLPDSSDPVIGQLIGLDRREPQRMNRVTLRSGRALSASAGQGGVMEAWVSEAFATARGLKAGSSVSALVNGKRRTLRVVGIALSPEYIFAGLFGMPDQRGFGVFWVDRDALSAAYDMGGAFNRVAVKLAPQADENVVIDALAQRLARYGGRAPNGREHQTSHAMLDSEMKVQTVMGTVLPAIFLLVAAFLLNVVVSRLVATQRGQIAALKALGCDNRAIGWHYLKLVLAIVSLGLVLGLLLGDVLGGLFSRLYTEVFRFPHFVHRVGPQLIGISVGLTLFTAVFGTFNALIATVRLTPAEAMRPPSPGNYRPAFSERLLGAWGQHRPAVRMVLRNMERRPLRTGLSIVGVAAAVAIVIMGHFFRDAIDAIVDTQFNLAMRSDISVWTTEAVPDRARLELARLPGVTAVESTRFVSVNLHHGHRSERSQVRGYPAQPELYRIIDADGHAFAPSGGGLVMTDRLAEKLALRPGDGVEVEVLEGKARRFNVTLDRTVREVMGLNAYMDRRVLNHLLGDDDVSTGFLLGLARGHEEAALKATAQLPRVAGAFSKATMLRNMQNLSARNVRIMSTVLTMFASIIAIGVVYNNARIALAEREWELASLRVLGFTRAEVSALLLGELGLSIALALPIGMGLGWLLVHSVGALLANDQFLFPVVIRARTFAGAAVVVLLAGAGSALVVRRRIDQLDMVSALKTRD
ncbi:MAG: hypothetical protein RJA98_2998 [Pseudomonadota bacterium]